VLKANKGGALGSMVDWYIGRKLKASFGGLWVRGNIPDPAVGHLVYANHSSFWDGFVLHQLAQLGRWNAFAMMNEANLARYRFHTRMGAFSVRQGDAKSALETLRYAKSLLTLPRAVVCVFPQGEIRPAMPPLGAMSRGLEVLARTGQATCVPVAFRYCFFEGEVPEVLVDFGEPHQAVTLSEFETRLEAVVMRVMQAKSTEGFRRLVSGRAGVQNRWDNFRGLKSAGTLELDRS
jgi:1-acyl-sn-glycerol-3-phosphate acyltransferase